MHINAERLKANTIALSEIGGQPNGGVTRLAYSIQEKQAREWVAARFQECGLPVRLDAAGNLFAHLGGRFPSPVVMTGSHVDTVPNGGRFDGAAGTLAALEVANTLCQARFKPIYSIEFVVFAAEESRRFKAGNRFGSRALVGQVGPADAERLVDENGVTLAQAMRSLELDPALLPTAQQSHGDIKAFVELHIEQGTELQALGIPVGVVTRVTGTRRYQIEVRGRADHSGGTQMHARQDALAAAAQIILEIERAANEIGGSLVETVTTVSVEPNAMNIVPGKVVLGVDIRDIHGDALDRATRALFETVDSVAQQRGVATTITVLRETAPIELAPHLWDVMREAGARAGIPTALVPSHTGHDAISMSAIMDAGMIFVRNPGGQSHSPAECVEWDDLALAAQLLLETIVSLAENVHA
jgi:hydantoinase/carbamoylase family amidase